MQYKKMLIVKANGDMRIASNPLRRKLALDECGYPLIVDLPNAWGKVTAEEITIKLPPPPTVAKGK